MDTYAVEVPSNNTVLIQFNLPHPAPIRTSLLSLSFFLSLFSILQVAV